MISRYKLYSDAQLTELIQRHDTYAFEELYQRYWGLLYSFARRMLDNDEEAEDAVQESFINLYERAPGLYIQHSISAYLYRSLRNNLININKHKKIKETVLSSFKEHYERGVFETDETLRERELARLIETEIENLPPKMRRIFELSRKQYLSHKQIAAVEGVSEGTVKKQLYYAINKLRSRLGCMFWMGMMQAILWLHRNF